jgi:hypothetical protein
MSSSDEAAEEYSVIYDQIEVMDPVMYIDERRDLGSFYHSTWSYTIMKANIKVIGRISSLQQRR